MNYLEIASILLPPTAVAVAFWGMHKVHAIKGARQFIGLFVAATEEIITDPRCPAPVKDGLLLITEHIDDAGLSKNLANGPLTSEADTPFSRALVEMPDDLKAKVYRAGWFFLLALSYAHYDGWKLRRRLAINPSERATVTPVAWAASRYGSDHNQLATA